MESRNLHTYWVRLFLGGWLIFGNEAVGIHAVRGLEGARGHPDQGRCGEYTEFRNAVAVRSQNSQGVADEHIAHEDTFDGVAQRKGHIRVYLALFVIGPRRRRVSRGRNTPHFLDDDLSHPSDTDRTGGEGDLDGCGRNVVQRDDRQAGERDGRQKAAEGAQTGLLDIATSSVPVLRVPDSTRRLPGHLLSLIH